MWIASTQSFVLSYDFNKWSDHHYNSMLEEAAKAINDMIRDWAGSVLTHHHKFRSDVWYLLKRRTEESFRISKDKMTAKKIAENVLRGWQDIAERAGNTNELNEVRIRELGLPDSEVVPENNHCPPV